MNSATKPQAIRRRKVKRWTPEQCPVCGAKEGWDGARVSEIRSPDDALVPQLVKRVCSCGMCGARWETTIG